MEYLNFMCIRLLEVPSLPKMTNEKYAILALVLPILGFDESKSIAPVPKEYSILVNNYWPPCWIFQISGLSKESKDEDCY